MKASAAATRAAYKRAGMVDGRPPTNMRQRNPEVVSREPEILRLYREGKKPGRIGYKLGLTVPQVKYVLERARRRGEL
ncbi:hypothetical protein GCM10017056_47460 [Seohaeicola zhoushanensis]|uniref:Uncharacterized protein n=2 Tax=Seohaeicola zhoushanensis TaxID=1569283 RepID=A0A8J3MAM6_9RHOB|nr:hypothetical protein GCM10017056_47460 [Seohaeicola zhoushanensis]